MKLHALAAGLAATLSLAAEPAFAAASDVFVTNAHAKPVPVEREDNDAKQPFQITAQPDTSSNATTTIQIPAGKRLELTFISAEIAAGVGSVFLESTVNGQLTAWYLLRNTDYNTRIFLPCTIYADPGTALLVVAQSSNGNRAQADVELAGHFTTVP
jgi:hypothetical protein